LYVAWQKDLRHIRCALAVRKERAGEIQKGSAALETPTEAELARRKKIAEEIRN